MSSVPAQLPQLQPSPAVSPRKPQLMRQVFQSIKLYLVLLLLMAPTLIGMIIFTYTPQWETVRHALYRWDGYMIEDWVKWDNFKFAVTDPSFWPTFQLVLILLAANLVKMWPSILTAVVLHRIRSEKWQYRYRVLFVVPMIIPALVGVLIWKTFYDAEAGPLNKALNGTGLISALRGLDVFMPKVAAVFSPLRTAIVDHLFGSVWAMLLVGVLLLSLRSGLRRFTSNAMWFAILAVVGICLWIERPWYMLAWLVLLPCAVEWIVRRYELSGRSWVTWAGIAALAIGVFLILFSMVWTQPTHAFDDTRPAWLSHTKLIIPAMIFCGFPWVGTVGVLIYLAGLQSISQDVYEAAEIDGVTSWGKLTHIELPLMLTQIRINLVFLTIGTLTDYGLVLLLLDVNGGNGNVGMVPGLYMFRKGFVEGEFGYACALGMILFVIILGITIFYQKYVRVEK